MIDVNMEDAIQTVINISNKHQEKIKILEAENQRLKAEKEALQKKLNNTQIDEGNWKEKEVSYLSEIDKLRKENVKLKIDNQDLKFKLEKFTKNYRKKEELTEEERQADNRGRKPMFTPEQVKQVIQYINMGNGVTETARYFNTSRQTIYNVVDQYNREEKARQQMRQNMIDQKTNFFG